MFTDLEVIVLIDNHHIHVREEDKKMFIRGRKSILYRIPHLAGRF
jgi:hypothetical protein